MISKLDNSSSRTNVQAHDSNSSLNHHIPPSSTSSSLNGNTSRPRSSFFNIIRQGFELFREDYSNQYIEVRKEKKINKKIKNNNKKKNKKLKST